MTSEKGFEHLKTLVDKLGNHNVSTSSESDTRAKLITAILVHVLGWDETDIVREEHTAAGYTDYILSTQRRALVVEAKRSGDTFVVPVEAIKKQSSKVGGILRTVPNLKSHIDQVTNYCSSSGIEYAVITNGHQWLIFRGARVDGITVAEGKLIIFSSLHDVIERFMDFWNLLSRSAVFANSLQQALHPTMSPAQHRRLTDELHDRNDKVSRNALSIEITPLIHQYLQEITDDASQNLLLDLYVKSRSLEAVFSALEYRLSLALSPTLTQHSVISEDGDISQLQASLETRVHRAIARKRGETILLLGRVGSGKTTFVNHFLRVDLKRLFSENLLVYIDYRNLEPGKDLRQFFYDQLRRALGKNETFARLAGENVRKVFAPEIRELTLGALAVLERTNKVKYEEKIADYLEAQYTDNIDRYYTRSLRYAAEKLGIRCLIVFDNVDQLASNIQQDIFVFAHSISSETLSLSFLAMWEETYVRSRRTGALSAYATAAYALPQLSIVDVLRRRLQFLVDDLRAGGPSTEFVPNEQKIADVADFFELVNNSIQHDRLRARFFLESIAMGNLRRAMDIFATFLTSGHTDSGKMLSIVRRTSNYLIPLHEFIKSIGLEDNKIYQSDLSPILNLYTISDESRPSHFTKVRILEYLYFHRNRSAASYGVGFIRLQAIKKDLEAINTSETDIVESIKRLGEYSLIENDIYDVKELSKAYRITPAGRYYIRYLTSRFSYLDLVYQDTPVADSAIFEKLKALFKSHEMTDRFNRVRTFLEYLDQQEEAEYSVVMMKSESIPLRKRFMPEYRASLESDIKFIKHPMRRSKNQGTPYSSTQPASQ